MCVIQVESVGPKIHRLRQLANVTILIFWAILKKQPMCGVVQVRNFKLTSQLANANLQSSCSSGCGSVGRAVAFNSRGPRFDSSHQQNVIEHLVIINCIEKTKINKKRPGMAHTFKKTLNQVQHLNYLYLLIQGQQNTMQQPQNKI